MNKLQGRLPLAGWGFIVLILTLTAYDRGRAQPTDDELCFQYTPKIASVRFSPDGNSLAVHTQLYAFGHPESLAQAGYLARIWDLRSGELIRSFKGVTYATAPMAFSLKDGVVIIADKNRLNLMKISTGELIRKMIRADGEYLTTSLSFSPDGTLIAGAGNVGGFKYGQVKLWDAETGQERHIFGGLPGGGYHVKFSPEGSLLACAGENNKREFQNTGTNLDVWTLADNKLLHHIVIDKVDVYDLFFSPDGTKLVTIGNFLGGKEESAHKTDVRCWNVQKGTVEYTIPQRWGYAVSSLTFSSDGKTLVGTGYESLDGDSMRMFVLGYDAANGRDKYQVDFIKKALVYKKNDNGVVFSETINGYRNSVVDLSPDDQVLAIGFWDGSVELRKVRDASLIQSFNATLP